MLILLLFDQGFFLKAQVAINPDGSQPNSKAMLDVKASDKGILIPRLTTVQRTAIPTPPDGLLVYDTDTRSFWFVKNTTWSEITGTGSGVGWSTSGNSGTDPATNFIGTTDNKSFVV